MKKLYGVLISCEQVLSKIMILLLIFLVFGAAMSRAFGFPLPWSIELAQAFFAWFVFLAASQATRRDAHMGVDILVKKLPEKIRTFIEIFNLFLIAVFLIILTFFGIKLCIGNHERLLLALGVSYSFISSSVAVGCFLMLVSVLIRISSKIISLIKGNSEK